MSHLSPDNNEHEDFSKMTPEEIIAWAKNEIKEYQKLIATVTKESRKEKRNYPFEDRYTLEDKI